jgi:hypothetical protein
MLRCKPAWALAAVLAPLAALPSVLASPRPDAGGLVVHEWGTFLSVQGSDGSTQGGMVDSEERLPRFVRERELAGYRRGSLYQKMETPVTYFYTDRPMQVQVRVGMPQGLLTHWFPAVRNFGPAPDAKTATAASSFLDWGRFDILPDVRADKAPPPPLIPVGKDDTWRFSRETDAALVRMADNPRVPKTGEWEKFLFYRGLGAFDLPLQTLYQSGPASLLTLRNRGSAALQAVFAVEVEKDGLRFAALPDLPGGQTWHGEPAVFLSPKMPLAEGVPHVKAAVGEALVRAGLYRKEATAMVNTWEESYFRTEGLRVLYVLPRATVDEVIPIRIQPAPRELVRVMVGRVEVLTPATERKVEKAVADLASKDLKVRQAAQSVLNRLGRIQEPVLRRVAALTRDVGVRERAEGLVRAAAK